MGAKARFGSVVTTFSGVAVAMGAILWISACSSDSSSTLSEEQRTELSEMAAAFAAAESVVLDAFAADIVVPRLELWQEAEDAHQQALSQLADSLPEGACRSAVESLQAIEEGQNVIRLQLIEHYRQQEFGLVAADTVAYGQSVVDGALQAEEAVFTACGRSTVDPARTSDAASSLTPGQNAAFDSVVGAYQATVVAFDDVFSVSEFVADIEALEVADTEVVTALNEAVASLGEGPCREALGELQALEQQQTTLRQEMIAAGQGGDLVTMIETLGEYAEVNSSSSSFTAARQSAVDNCGADV